MTNSLAVSCLMISYLVNIFVESQDISALNTSISNNIYQFNWIKGNCEAIGIINTDDQGYLVVGSLTFLSSSSNSNFILLKYNKANQILFKTPFSSPYSEVEIHRIQELDNFYFVITLYRDDDNKELFIKCERFSKSGMYLPISVFIDNPCVHQIKRYDDFLFIIFDDTTVISNCMRTDRNNDLLYYVTDIESNNDIYGEDIYAEKSYRSTCYVWQLKKAAKLKSKKVVAFGGQTILSSSGTWKSINELFFKPKWQDFLNAVYFRNTATYANLIKVNDDFCDCKDRNWHGQDFWPYKKADDTFIELSFSNFDLKYTILNLSYGYYDDQIFNKPSNLDFSIYVSPEVTSIVYNEPFFLFTGSVIINSVRSLFAAVYEDIQPSKGYINYYPNPLPSECSSGFCAFIGRGIVKCSSGEIIVVGNSKFPNSQGMEWLRLVYSPTMDLILQERKENNGDFEPTISTNLVDGSTIILGKDLYALTLIQLSTIYNIINQDRLIIENDLVINSIVQGNGLSFYAAGYITKFDSNDEIGCVLEFSSSFDLLRSLFLDFPSAIQSIIFLNFEIFYGALNFGTSSAFSDAMIFQISKNFDLSTFDKIKFVGINLKSITLSSEGNIFAVGNKGNLVHIVSLNKKLFINNEFQSDKTNLEIFKSKIILNSVASTYSGNIIAVGNILGSTSQDCFIVLFNPILEVENFQFFGTRDKDDINQIIPLSDFNVMITGFESKSGFLRLYSPTLILVLEKLFSEQNIILTTLTENSFEAGMTAGWKSNNNIKSLIIYSYEISLACDSGFKYDPETATCKEICGDNNDHGNYECDNILLSCCNIKTCTIPKGYHIITNLTNGVQTCNQSYNILSKANLLLSKSQGTISLTFSSNMTLCDDLVSGSISEIDIINQISVFLKNTSSTIKLQVIKMEYENCNLIKFSFIDKSNSIEYSKFIIIDFSYLYLTDSNGIRPEIKPYTFKIKDKYKNQNDGSTQNIHLIDSTQNVIVIIGLLTSLLTSVLQEGMNGIFNYFGPLQIICLFSLINLKPFPDNINSIINANSIVSLNFNYIQLPFTSLMSNETATILTSTNKIDDNSMLHPSLNLINIFFNLQIKIIILLCYPIFFISVYILSWKSSFFKTYFNSMKWNGFINLFHGIYFEFMICSIMQLFHSDKSLFWITNLGDILAIISLIAILLYCLKTFSILYSAKIEKLFEPETRDKFENLYLRIREIERAKYHIYAYYLRRFLHIIFLFALMNYPIAQSSAFVAITAFYILWLIRIKPEKNRINEFGNIIIEMIIILISLSFIFISLINDPTNSFYCSGTEFIGFCMKFATMFKSSLSYFNLGDWLLNKIKKMNTDPNNNSKKDVDKPKEESKCMANVTTITSPYSQKKIIVSRIKSIPKNSIGQLFEDAI